MEEKVRLALEKLYPFGFVAILAVVALFSATVLSNHYSSEETYQGIYEQLDEKRENVIALTASSAAISAGITLLPDDTGTPIAEELSQISMSFAIVIAALLLEKYLLTTLGFTFFTFVVPICCALLAASLLMRPTNPSKHSLRLSAVKLFAFGLVLLISIPVSVQIASNIDDTYSETIATTIEESKEVSEAVEETTNAQEKTEEENSEDFLAFLQEKIEGLQSTASSIVEDVTGALDWAKGEISKYVELFAVMMVTSIVIPVAVPIVIYIAFKLLFGQTQIILTQSALPPAALPETPPTTPHAMHLPRKRDTKGEKPAV